MKDEVTVKIEFWLEFPDLGYITGRCRFCLQYYYSIVCQ